MKAAARMRRPIKATHDPAADAVWIKMGSGKYAETKELDGRRRLDVAADGTVLSVELLDVSDGVDLSDLPRAAEIEQELRRLGVPLSALSSAR